MFVGSGPSVNVKIGGKLPIRGMVEAVCTAHGQKGMAVNWYVVKPNRTKDDIIKLKDGLTEEMHTVERKIDELNSTFIKESVKLTIKYNVMSVLTYFKCKLKNAQFLICQGSYKCVADFSPPKRGVYMENVAIVNIDGAIREFLNLFCTNCMKYCVIHIVYIRSLCLCCLTVYQLYQF